MFAAGILLLVTGSGRAEAPAWWAEQSVLNENPAQDRAVANQGQLKYLAAKAADEFHAKLPSVDLTVIDALVNSFTEEHNRKAVNLGQLKYIAKPFYDVLEANGLQSAWPEGMTVGPYPWSGSASSAQDLAAANIGQLKYVFSFQLSYVNLDPAADSDGDGLTNQQEIDLGTSPGKADTDGDGLPDGYEVLVGLNPLVSDATNEAVLAYAAADIDPDGDGAKNWLEAYHNTNPYDRFD